MKLQQFTHVFRLHFYFLFSSYSRTPQSHQWMVFGFKFFQTPVNVDILTLFHKLQMFLNGIYNFESFIEGFQLTLSGFMRSITFYSSYSLLKCIYFLNNKT